jgi:NAD(P)H-hydrate epimerase
MKVVTVEEMRHLEAASDEAGHTYDAMMERAGQAVAQAIVSRRKVQDEKILLLIGPGNNGGDGLVAGRYLAQVGAQVIGYLYEPRDPAEDQNYRMLEEMGTTIVLASDDDTGERLTRLAREADIIVDALLGTGTRLPLRGALADLLHHVQRTLEERVRPARQRLTSLTRPTDQYTHLRTPAFVVAVDGPTGLAYDSGDLDEVALPADITVTFAFPKRGHFRFPGANALGELIVADIGIDPALSEDVTLEVATSQMIQRLLPARPLDAHKGTFGKALIVAGSVNYTGAAYLAGQAATHAGAGLVTVALPSAIHTAIATHLPEATYLLLPQDMGTVAPEAVKVLNDHLEDYDALLVGPGLSTQRGPRAFLAALLGKGESRGTIGFIAQEETPTPSVKDLPPLIVDADGLNILSQHADWLAQLPQGSILTPHPGEMARLMDRSIADVQRDRVETARAQAAQWNQVIVLKGAHTVVAAPDGRTVLLPFANPGLATAGTGDVLAGTITAMRAQGLDPFAAALAGAYLHGLAGALAREARGTTGMTAGDVLDHLPPALHRLSA